MSPSSPHAITAATTHRGLPRIIGPDRRPLPAWHIVADAITDLAAKAVADPHHPWTRRWPSSSQMAAQFGTSQYTVLTALRYLAEKGVLVKVKVPLRTGDHYEYVPAVRAMAFSRPPSVEQVAAWLADQAMRGRLDVVPALRGLAPRIGVRRTVLVAALHLLHARGLAHRARVRGVVRWRIIPPHELRARLDPRDTVPLDRVIHDDLVRRIRSGEFRCRTPDGRVHERAFPTNIEIHDRYGGSSVVIGRVRRALCDAGYIVAGPRPGSRHVLAPHVLPVDREKPFPPPPPPPPQAPRPPRPRNKLAHGIAEDLLLRIRSGEFATRPLPSQTGIRAEYGVGSSNARAALEELCRRGWAEFRFHGAHEIAVLVENPPADDPPGHDG